MSAPRRPYREVWRIPGAPLLLVGGTVARLGQGITVLAWLLLVVETTGSYGLAATVTAMTSVAIAVAAPVGGRLADRFGADRVLPVYAVAYATTQCLLLVAVLMRSPVLVLCALGLLTGATFPPVGPALRAAWAVLTRADGGRQDSRTAAMAIDAALFEVVFVVGPLLLSAFALAAGPLGAVVGAAPAVVGPAGALVTAALCTLVGTLAVARGEVMRAARPGAGAPTRGLGPLRLRGLRAMLVVTAGIAVSFGAAPVALAAWSAARDGAAADAVTGILVAVWSLGSAGAGLWFGTRRFTAPLARQLGILTAALAAGYGTWLLAPDSWWLGGILFVTGAVIAPLLTVQANLVAHIAPPSMLTESYTWLTTTNLSSVALGSAATGVVVDLTGSAGWGFAVAAGATLLAAAVACRPGIFEPAVPRAADPVLAPEVGTARTTTPAVTP